MKLDLSNRPTVTQMRHLFENGGLNVEIVPMADDVKEWDNMVVKHQNGEMAGIFFFIQGKMVEGRELDKLRNKEEIRRNFKGDENKMLTEIYRRLNVFHKGNVNHPQVLLALPSESAPLKKLGLISPYGGRETARVLNWYGLTEKGKRFFKDYIEPVDDETNEAIFEGYYVKQFKKPYWLE